MNNVEAIKQLIHSWHSTRDWAESILCKHLSLIRAEDVLLPEHRGKHQLGDTDWFYRTHGVGVDVSKNGNKGGIDFDFNLTKPDKWRLREFLIKQLNDGNLVKKNYKKFLHNQEEWECSFDKAVSET